MSVCTNVQIVYMCVCVCALRAGGHRRIKQRQKDEHLVGLGRIEGWLHWTNGGVPQMEGVGRGDAEREEAEGREGAGRQKRWCGDGR